MAFKIATKKTVWWPVDIPVPVDGGRSEIQKIDAHFDIIEQTEADKVVYGESETKDLLVRVVVGLRQRKTDPKAEDAPMQDENGSPIQFEEAKPLMLEIPYVRTALYAAYGKAASGQGRAKN